MGKGDKKSRKGKIAMGSYGILRPRKKVTAKPDAVKKVVAPLKKVVASESIENESVASKKSAAPKKSAASKKAAAPKKAVGKKAE